MSKDRVLLRDWKKTKDEEKRKICIKLEGGKFHSCSSQKDQNKSIRKEKEKEEEIEEVEEVKE